MKQTQSQKVVELLKAQGFVTRNWALQNYISRLSAIIQDLEAVGWVFETYRDEGDYGYRVVQKAMKTITKVEERDGKYYQVKVQVPV